MKSTRADSGVGAKNIVGPKVRKVRQGLKPTCTQEDLSGRLAKLEIKMDRTAVARLEMGDRYVMDYELVALAKALRVDVGELLKP